MDILIWIGKVIALCVIILLIQYLFIIPITDKIDKYRRKRKKEFDKELKDKIEIEVNKQISKYKKIN